MSELMISKRRILVIVGIAVAVIIGISTGVFGLAL